MQLTTLLKRRSKFVENDEITLIDGKITPVLSTPDKTLPQKLAETPRSTTVIGELTPIELTLDEDSEQPFVTILADDELSEEVRSFQVQPKAQPSNGSHCYLLDHDVELDEFLTYLTELHRSARTQYEYVRYLRLIKQHLLNITSEPNFSGTITTAHIQTIFQQYSPSQAHIMRSVLKTYTKYRIRHCDERLTVFLASYILPAIPKHPQNNILTNAEIPLIQELARELITQHQCAGIWIMLCLHGVLPHEIKNLRMTSRITIHVTRRGKDISFTNLPTWLTRAMENMHHWRVNRHNIYLGLQPYNLTPYILNTYAKQQAALKQEQQKALQQKVKKSLQQRQQGIML